MKMKSKRLYSLILALAIVLSLVSGAIVPAVSADSSNVYEGKVFSILGDSISTYSGYIPVSDGFNAAHKTRYPDASKVPDVTSVDQTWWMQVITQLGGQLGINDSWRGTTIYNAHTVEVSGNYGTKAALSSPTRIQNLGANGTPDVIMFYGGTNDIRLGRELGSFDPDTAPVVGSYNDWTTATWSSVAEAYAATLVRMKELYPDAQIISLLPTHTWDKAEYAERLPVYNAMFKQICDHYDVPWVDLSDPAYGMQATTDYFPDKIHPNANCMDLITDGVLGLLEEEKADMTAGAHTVHKITHELTNATASKFYYKGVDGGEAFTETITNGSDDITVIMNGVDVTSSVYSDGVINIPEVTGYVYITDTLSVDANSNIILNKIAKLENNGTYSIDLSGYVTGETKVNNYTSAAPLDVILVLDASGSMLQFRNNSESYYARTIQPFSDGTSWPYAKESYPTGATNTTNLWEHFSQTSKTLVNASDGKGTLDSNSRIRGSIMIPVKPGDKIYCTSFGLTDNNTNGIRVSYFKQNGEFLSTVGPGTVYENFNANILKDEDGNPIDRNGNIVTSESDYVHYIQVPDNAYAMNIPVWRTGTDANPVINNLCLNELRYNPTTTKEFNQMRAKLLQEQVQKFADSLAEASRVTGVEHKLAMVTFGAGASGDSGAASTQGLFGKHVGVNGWTNHFYTNTGLFVNGQFKNYFNHTTYDDKVLTYDPNNHNATRKYAYTPTYEVSTSQTYYHLEWDENGDGGYDFDGKMTSVTYNADTGTWVDTNGKTVKPRTAPYDSNSTTLFYTRSLYNPIEDNKLTNADYRDALTSILGSDGNLNSDLQYAIDRYVARGTTYTRYGLAMARNILKQNGVRSYTDEYNVTHQGKQVVILFTDGDTNNSTANNFAPANEIKKLGAELYTIGLDEAANLKWMDQISSNNTNFNQLDVDENAALSGGDYYFGIDAISELDTVIDNISNDVSISKTTITLDDTAVMQDYLNTGFVLPENFGFGNISVSTVALTTTDDTTYVEGAKTSFTYSNTDSQGYGIYTNASGDVLKVSFDRSAGKIAVIGFDYATNFVATEHPGKKLVVNITGIEATNETTVDNTINTNGVDSGILYTKNDSTTGVYPFEHPKTHLTSKLYIVDYAKPIVLDPTQWSNSYLGMADETRLNCDMSGDEIVTSAGTFTYNEANDTITFTPTNMSWSEAAIFYVLGTWDDSKPSAVTTGDNVWTKVSIIPANNIYYEDDFADITYTGNWSSDGTTSNSTENPEGATGDADGVHGWEGGLVDSQYSDGAAHMGVVSSSTKAEASFTFTGTGVDIYGRTDSTTGTVLVTLQGTEAESGTPVFKIQIVDTQSVSGDYYQIPAVSFMDLAYGTYTVTIRVTTSAAERFAYYLDGVRVYKPVQDDSAYATNEQNATFVEIRDLLEKQVDDTNTGGAVFVDKAEDGTVGQTVNYAQSQYGLYGPKNEVYLTAGQSITFKVDSSNADAYYYVGLKAPEGTGSTVVKVSNGDETTKEITINHSTDLYYQVIPDDEGYVTIENMGNYLLSVTKLRVAGAAESAQVLAITEEEAVFALRSFSLRPVFVAQPEPEIPENPDVPGEQEPVDPEIPENPDAPGDQEPVDPEIPENPEVPGEENPETGDVDVVAFAWVMFGGLFMVILLMAMWKRRADYEA